MPTRSEKVTFIGSQGDTLAARLDWPEGPVRAFALFAHCFTCSKDIFAVARITQGLARHGIATLRFDFTGLGASEGEFANTNFSSNVQDLVAAAGYLAESHRAPQILIGHSLGGAAVLVAAKAVPSAVAVATIGAPADPEHLGHMLAGKLEDIKSQGEAEVVLGGRSFTIKRQFLEDISSHNLTESVAGMHKALIVFHAPLDDYVGISNAGTIFGAAKHPKSFISLDDADHLLSRRADAIYVADVLSAWVSRYLPDAEAAKGAGEASELTVEENGQGPFGQDIRVGPHLIHADEPPNVGGRNGGLTPYQLLSASLGACTSMTVRMYANHKKWPLDKVRVTVRHDKIHAADCAECETREGKVDAFERLLEITGDLDAEQRRRLLEIADKCPVHRTLHSEVSVRTTLAE